MCLSLLARRLHPVASLFPYVSLRLWDQRRPFLLQRRLLLVDELRRLAVCDVCGSYQCADCPDAGGLSSDGGRSRQAAGWLLWMLALLQLLWLRKPST